MRRILLLALLSWAGAKVALAQTLPIISQNPTNLRWRQVNTPHFRVLYPQGLDSAAQRTAQRLERVHGPEGATLGVQAKPISVVMQAQTTISNGFVTFLPRHAEFFITPQQSQSLGTVDWLDGLVVHEFRHVNQFDKARQGFGRVLVPLLGDGGLGVMAVGVPQWFFEGDAVGTETAFTRSGRGRIPNFNVGLRANLLAGRFYNYQKASNGSLRDNVPDWYVLGYFLTSYAKAHYGADVWDRTLSSYYRFPFYPFSFSHGVRRATGLRVEELYDRTMHELDSTWRAEQTILASNSSWTPRPGDELAGQEVTKVFTQYEYPQYLTDSTIVALKSGLGHIPQLVVLGRTGRERKLFVPGLVNIPEMLSAAAGKVVWPEFRYHPRWQQKVYSELKVLDVKTGKLTSIGQRQRYSTAALSPDGQRIVAEQTDVNYHHSLVILNAETGAVENVLPNPRNDFYQQPRWLPDGRRLVAVTLSAAGKTLQVIDPATGTAQNLLPVANVNLANPQPWGEYVLYNSPQAGVDNIYAVALQGGQTYRVTNRPLGAYHAAVAPGGRTLAFHDYRATGARVVEMPLAPATWEQIPAATADMPGPYATQLSTGEPAGREIARQLARPDSTGPRYGVRRYSPLAHTFKVFSYGVVQSPAGDGVSVGLRSQDVLSTTQAFAGLSYDQTERTFSGLGALSYQGLFPVIDVEGEYGGRNAALYIDRKLPLDSLVRDQWRYSRLRVGLRLPFTLTRSKYLQALTVGSFYFREQVYDYDLPVRRRTEVSPRSPLNALQTYLSYVAQLKQSARDVAPRGGGALLATWRTTPFGSGLEAGQFGSQASVYLPGLGRHHALRLRAGYQWQDQAQYQFSAAISFPRGEGYTSFDKLRTSSFDYYLPLAYPHISLGRLLYVQRLRATAFADVARGESQVTGGRVQVDYRNVGADFLVLFNVLRLRTPVEAGVRVVYSSLLQGLVVEPLAFSLRL
jgi:hypothetical protein